jgi:hypothetical protein
MAKPAIICSLVIENLKPATRSIAGTIVGPFKSGLVHFRQLPHIAHAIKLEENNQINIKTDIPQHVYFQLTIPSPAAVHQEKTISIDKPAEPLIVEETITESTEVVKPLIVEEVLAAPVEIVDVTTTESNEAVKPEWYLTWEQVEDLSKTDLIEHFKGVEEIDLPKSKNAAQTKELAHEALNKLFADHVE